MNQKTVDTVKIASQVTKETVEALESIFHIEDLYNLARQNSFIAMNFFELVCNLDYVILTPMDAKPVGQDDTGIIGVVQATFSIDGNRYPFTLRGKLAAIADCFRKQANKMDGMLSTEILSAFMQGTGAAQIAQDAVNAFANAGMQILQNQQVATKIGASNTGIAELAKVAPAIAAAGV